MTSCFWAATDEVKNFHMLSLLPAFLWLVFSASHATPPVRLPLTSGRRQDPIFVTSALSTGPERFTKGIFNYQSSRPTTELSAPHHRGPAMKLNSNQDVSVCLFVFLFVSKISSGRFKWLKKKFVKNKTKNFFFWKKVSKKLLFCLFLTRTGTKRLFNL